MAKRPSASVGVGTGSLRHIFRALENGLEDGPLTLRNGSDTSPGITATPGTDICGISLPLQSRIFGVLCKCLEGLAQERFLVGTPGGIVKAQTRPRCMPITLVNFFCILIVCIFQPRNFLFLFLSLSLRQPVFCAFEYIFCLFCFLSSYVAFTPSCHLHDHLRQ